MSDIDISIIIPNLHSPIIGKTIESLQNQDFLGVYEIIIVGRDRYSQVIEDDIITFIETDTPVNPATARNIGIHASRGQIIAFIDSDCIAAKDWISTIEKSFGNPRVHIQGGGIKFSTDNFWGYCDNVAAFHEYLATLTPGIRQQLPSLNLCVRKSALMQVGLFNENKLTGEDTDLSARFRLNGYTLFFNPEITVFHISSRKQLKAILKRFYLYGRYSSKIDRKYKELFKSRIFLSHWSVLLVFSPLLASMVVIKVLYETRLSFFSLLAAPIIFMSKLSWCLGAVVSLKRGIPWL